MKFSIKSLVSLFALAVFFSFGAAGEANAQVDEILKRMDAHNKALTSLRADVSMEKFDNVLKDSEVTKGKVIYKPRSGRKALVRVDWVSPNESFAVVDDKYLIYRPRLKQYMTGSTSSKQGSSANGLEFMNMSRQQLRENYSIVYLGEANVGSEGTWHLRLTPKKASNYKSAEIWVNKDGMPVQSKIISQNNDSTTVRLSAMEKNIKIDNSQFQIAIPKGTQEIKS